MHLSLSFSLSLCRSLALSLYGSLQKLKGASNSAVGAKEWLDGDVAPRELYNWTTNPDVMAHTWKAAIEANADKDMIWTVGLRGLWDYTCEDRDVFSALMFRGTR